MAPEATSDATSAPKRPKVGIGCFVVNGQNEFLMGKRIGSNGAGTYALPGGHLEFGESFEDCASREVEEETGLSILPVDWRYLTTTNNVLVKDGQHYVTVFMVGQVQPDARPQNLEPEKCEGWEWVSWQQLLDWAEAQRRQQMGGQTPARLLFQPMLNLLEQRPDVTL